MISYDLECGRGTGSPKSINWKTRIFYSLYEINEIITARIYVAGTAIFT